jgi:integral membrane protein
MLLNRIKTTFRVIAFLEGVSFILLMTVGLYCKYQLDDPSYVKLLGMPHGLLFISYLILAFLIKNGEQWKNKDFGIIILASILPFGTFYVDFKYLK